MAQEHNALYILNPSSRGEGIDTQGEGWTRRSNTKGKLYSNVDIPS